MKKILFAAILFSACVITASAQDHMKEKTVTVGGAPMYPSKNIVENAGHKIKKKSSKNVSALF